MRSRPSAVVLFFLAPCVACGQEQAAPKPGAEVGKLGYYLGTWEGHGESKGEPFGPAGKLSSRMTCNWFAGGFHMVCRGEERGPTGQRGFLNILGYDENLLVSSDFKGNPLSSIVDGPLTKVIGNSVKVLSWYDNEWGYSNRVVDLIGFLVKKGL